MTGTTITPRISPSTIWAMSLGKNPPGWTTCLARIAWGAIALPALWPATSSPGDVRRGWPHFMHLRSAPLLAQPHRGQIVCQDSGLMAAILSYTRGEGKDQSLRGDGK